MLVYVSPFLVLHFFLASSLALSLKAVQISGIFNSTDIAVTKSLP